MGKAVLILLAAGVFLTPSVEAAKTAAAKKKPAATAAKSAKKPAPRVVARRRAAPVRRVSPSLLLKARYVEPELGSFPEMSPPLPDMSASELHDSFFSARKGRRVHQAIDIMRPTGTPLYSCVDGFVEKINSSILGGKAVYLTDATGGHRFYYAHLSGYADGLIESMPVLRGQLIGYVGNTGNARFTGPHLHFQIMQGARAVNPFPVLASLTVGRIPIRPVMPAPVADALRVELPEAPAADPVEQVVPEPTPVVVEQPVAKPPVKRNGPVPLVTPDYSIPSQT